MNKSEKNTDPDITAVFTKNDLDEGLFSGTKRKKRPKQYLSDPSEGTVNILGLTENLPDVEPEVSDSVVENTEPDTMESHSDNPDIAEILEIANEHDTESETNLDDVFEYGFSTADNETQLLDETALNITDNNPVQSNSLPTEEIPFPHINENAVLDGRYTRLQFVSYGNDIAAYLGFDDIRGERVLISEFFPADTASRAEDGVSVLNTVEKTAYFKAQKTEFFDLYETLFNLRKSEEFELSLQKIRSVFEENNTVYIVFKYYEGITLRGYLKKNKGRIAWDKAAGIFRPVVRTLIGVHGKGLIHRAISPSNIFIGKNGDIVLTGFRTAMSGTAVSIAKPSAYYAPELYSPSGKQSQATDIYSICAVIFRTLTGYNPPSAPAREENDKLRKTLQGLPDSFGIPDEIKDALEKGLALEWEERPHTFAELSQLMFLETDTPEVNLGMKKNDTMQFSISGDKTEKNANRYDTQTIVAPQKQPLPKRYIILIAFLSVSFLLIIGLFSLPFLYPELVDKWLSNRHNPAETTGTGESGSTSYSATVGQSSESLPGIETSPSDNSPQIEIPDSKFVGENVNTLRNTYSGFFEFTETPKYDDSPYGTVLSSNAVPGYAQKGTTIKVTVSAGSRYYKPPQYLGKDRDQYAQMLTNDGIQFTFVAINDATYPYNVIIGFENAQTGNNFDRGKTVTNQNKLVIYFNSFVPVAPTNPPETTQPDSTAPPTTQPVTEPQTNEPTTAPHTDPPVTDPPHTDAPDPAE